MKKTLTLWCLVLFALDGFAQVGGLSTFDFLRLSPSARITALGGSIIPVRDDDPALAVHNPAALNVAMDRAVTFQHNFHFDDVYNGYAGYAHHLGDKEIMLHAGVQFIQYGTFDRADEFGNLQGEFKANELALTIGAARPISERMAAGVNLRFVNSNLESYHSFAILADIGGMYWDPDQQLTASLVIRNVGAQISTYAEGAREEVPLDVQLGISKRLKYLPFRLTVIAHSLQRWDLHFEGPLSADETTLFGEEANTASGFDRELDNFFRHFIFGGEFLLGKEENLMLRFGYNHQRRREMSLASLRSFAGFSLGFGLRIKQFRLDYGFGVQHIAGSTQHIGISTNLNRFGSGILD